MQVRATVSAFSVSCRQCPRTVTHPDSNSAAHARIDGSRMTHPVGLTQAIQRRMNVSSAFARKRKNTATHPRAAEPDVAVALKSGKQRACQNNVSQVLDMQGAPPLLDNVFLCNLARGRCGQNRRLQYVPIFALEVTTTKTYLSNQRKTPTTTTAT